jgi:antitoxin HicB
VTTYRYTVIIHPEENGQGYWAEVPALPGCNTQGDTVAEAITNAQEAVTAYIGSLRLAGEPVPQETEHHQAVVIDVNAAA